ncbi:MAG TPA: hypothetical protein PJ992_11205 [Arachnia sp.]|nr:hypothetical protein [Arachnia sp.]
MPPKRLLPETTRRRLRAQHGAVLVSQLLEDGLSRQVCRRLTTAWARIMPGLYLAGPPSFESAAWAGLLCAGPGAVVGADAAAYLSGVLCDPPAEIVVWSPRHRVPFTVGQWRVRFRRGVRVGRGSPPRLSVEDSLVDLARDHDEVGAIDAVARALSRRRTTPERVLSALAERQRVRHTDAITQLCTAAGTGIESGLEWLFHKDVLTAHGLPLPRRQAVSEEGRIDGFYDDWSVIVELDGIRDHSDWSKDMFRDNAHALRLDAVTLRYGWTGATRHPCAAAGQVSEALAARGWVGNPRRCRRCPPTTALRGECLP